MIGLCLCVHVFVPESLNTQVLNGPPETSNRHSATTAFISHLHGISGLIKELPSGDPGTAVHSLHHLPSPLLNPPQILRADNQRCDFWFPYCYHQGVWPWASQFFVLGLGLIIFKIDPVTLFSAHMQVLVKAVETVLSSYSGLFL